MKLKSNLLFLFFLFFFTTNHLFAKYTGGNGDSYTVITGVIMQLDGQQTSAVKYAGGSYDGYHLSSSDLQYLGG